MQPTSAPAWVMPQLAASPLRQASGRLAMNDSARPSGYGCGMSSVVSAMARAPASRCTSGASSATSGRRIRRALVSVGCGSERIGGAHVGDGEQLLTVGELGLVEIGRRQGWRRGEGRLLEIEEIGEWIGVGVAASERRKLEAGLDEASDRGVIVD